MELSNKSLPLVLLLKFEYVNIEIALEIQGRNSIRDQGRNSIRDKWTKIYTK